MRCILVAVLALVSAGSLASAQSTLLTLDADYDGYALGSAVDVIGDIDHDGVADIAFSSPSYFGNGAYAGVVYVASGATGAQLLQLYGAPGNFLGREISRLGDVDGDGYPDFLVARDVTVGLNIYGAVEVRSGFDGATLHGVTGSANEQLYQCHVDDVGDVDGDGIPDYLVSAYSEGVMDEGLVEVRSGLDSAIIYTYAGAFDFNYMGFGASGIGDFDADGRPDFAITQRSNGWDIVSVYSGRTGAVIFSDQGVFDFGRGLAGAGDVDNDGCADLAVGDGHGYQAIGEVHVYSGRTHAELYSAQGLCDGAFLPPSGDGFGLIVEGVGDVDGDGRDDFAAASWNRWYALVFSGVDGSVLYTLRETPFSETATPSGLRIRGAPDMNGDGRAEVVLGAPFHRPVAPVTHVGRVQVFSDGTVVGVGNALGFGDGTGTPCPCGNTGQPGAGCANSTGLGATIAAFGTTSVAVDNLFFEADWLPPAKTALLVSGTSTWNGGLGLRIGDGLLVCAGATKRVWTTKSCAQGQAWWGTGLAPDGQWQAGDTRVFQAWYRDPSGPCASTFNFSNAVRVTFTP